MSAQIHDECIFQAEPYSVVWVEKGTLFQPQDFGLRPSFGQWRTDCISGFYCVFGLGRTGLLLHTLTVHAEDGRYPVIGGVVGQFDDEEGACVYDGMKLPLGYSGKLRIGKDFIWDLCEDGGPQSEIAFEKVVEFELRAGQMISALDISQTVGRQREALLNPPSEE